MGRVRVGGVQMQVGPTKKDNLPAILQKVVDIDCDFLLFPEMALTGPSAEFSDARTEEAWEQIGAACRKSYTTALVGTGARRDGHTYIKTQIFAQDGSHIGSHDKLQPTKSERTWCRPGDTLRVFEHRGMTFGCLIGNDLWVAPGHGPFPDQKLSYQLGEKGAQIIFLSAATGHDPAYEAFYESNVRLRAKEAGCYIVVANAAAAGGPVACPSGVVSPAGEWLVQCPREGEQHFVIDLDIELA